MNSNDIKQEVSECMTAVAENDEVMRLVLINTAAQVANGLLCSGMAPKDVGTEAVKLAKSIIKAANK